jgi:hypothetical protein
VSVTVLLFGAALGAGAMWLHFRGQAKRHEAEVREVYKALNEADASKRTADRRLALRARQLELAAAQRDDYAKIASSHEVDTARWAAGEWARKVWKERRYSGHPRENLADLRRDFEPFAEEHVLLSIDLELLGGWKTLLEGESSGASITTPLSAGETLLFEGPGERVIEQFSTFLHDDDTGFFVASDEGDGRWHDEDSPMVWRLTLDVLHPESPSHVQFVEVLKVQKELEEVIVERPVIRSVPPDVAASLSQHTKEEIVALVEAVLEVRELDLSRRLPAERAALPPSLGGDDA